MISIKKYFYNLFISLDYIDSSFDISLIDFWEVGPNDYGYDSEIAITINGKKYYAEC